MDFDVEGLEAFSGGLDHQVEQGVGRHPATGGGERDRQALGGEPLGQTEGLVTAKVVIHHGGASLGQRVDIREFSAGRAGGHDDHIGSFRLDRFSLSGLAETHVYVQPS